MPTLWRSHRTVGLLQDLDRSPFVGEIVLIDNARDARPALPDLPRLVAIDPGQNIFVNPAWNLGAQRATRPLLCIANDDVSFPVDEVLGFVWAERDRLGSFGVHPASYAAGEEAAPPRLEEGYDFHQRWGCLFFLARRSYVPIPERLRIWYGDNWLAARARPNYSLHTRVRTEHATSSRSPEFEAVLASDRRWWFRLYRWPTLLRDPARLVRKVRRRIRD